MPLTLAEFEARCIGSAPGEITPADVVEAINLVSTLGEAYRERLFAKAAAWKPPTRVRRRSLIEREFGIEKSLPRGDL